MKMTTLHPALRLSGLGVCVLWLGCASTPPPAPDPVVAPMQAAFEQKMRWILQLEDQRALRGSGGDLTTLVTDAAPRVRRRAALAIGRARLPEGVAALTPVLQGDSDPEVRQMAAFAMGLIGDRSASPALLAALADADPMIQGRAAEALGMVGEKDAAAAIGAMVAAQIDAGVFRALTPDDMGYPKPEGAEAARLGLYALVRLGAYDALAGAVLEKDGRVRSRWWPVAYALQRIGDPRAAPSLLELLKGEGQLTRAFAARGLGALKEPRAVALLLAAAENSGEAVAVRIQAVRAIAAIGDPRGAELMRRLIVSPKVDVNLQLEAVTALAQLPNPAMADLLIDLVTAQLPAVRSAALQSLARADGEIFTSAVSGFDPDPHWSVRAALASALSTLPRERAQPALTNLLRDSDQRVIPAVLDALTRVGADNAATEMLARLKAEDPVVRAAAARNLAALKAANAVPALVDALKTAQGDGLYLARTATLDALTALDPVAAKPVLAAALADRDWAVRMRAAENLRRLDPAADVSSMRPAPPPPGELGSVDALINPPYSPAAYIDTSKGTIQLELAVLDAPRTVASFIALVRRNYFRGVQVHRVVPDFVVQAGDPRGDGEGGPGYTIRDEINQRPYLRGTVGMALDWADSGGSQFFITHSPQPHLDGRYTVFGQVVSGMDVVDLLTQWDTIDRIRVWDGVNWIGQ
jgi:cyclophilin family peptidyl-prolyl cis-trans isomerase/HEAT repeat protein